MFLFVESMILLGSIERCELQAACEWWLSGESRVHDQGMPSAGSKASFTFVDEEDNKEKVWHMLQSAVTFTAYLHNYNFLGVALLEASYHGQTNVPCFY